MQASIYQSLPQLEAQMKRRFESPRIMRKQLFKGRKLAGSARGEQKRVKMGKRLKGKVPAKVKVASRATTQASSNDNQ